MLRPFAALLVFAAMVSAAALVHANDGAAERAAGGLVFRQNDDIDMVSEDLFISVTEVRVRYVFRNRTPRDTRITVAFPLPDYDLTEPQEGDVVWPSDFETSVEGRPVRTEVERRAVLRGVDRTDLLRSLGIPIAYYGDQQQETALAEALRVLPVAGRRRLLAEGLVRELPMGDEPAMTEPLWTVKETWYWDQVFPAGRNVVIEHRYRPGDGGTVGTALAIRSHRESDEGRARIARYCMDSAFLGAIDRIAEREGTEIPSISEVWVSYILTTGAGWRSPIGEFRLVVEKQRPEDLVSFCGEGVRLISPTQFEMRRRDWRPDRNLDVLFLRP
jgi:hypothetical protein